MGFLSVAATGQPSSLKSCSQGPQRYARSSSPGPTRPLYTSPERKLPTPNVPLPEDIDMSVFNKPISGRSWKADCAKRDHFLHGYAMGHRAHLISLLRNLVREMFIFKVEAERQEARRRGVGICVDPKAMFWSQHAKTIDGWTGTLPIAPLRKSDEKRSALHKENQMMEESFGHSNYLHAARCAPHGVAPTEKKPKPQLKRPEPTTAQKPNNEWMVVVNGKAVPKSALKKPEALKTPIGYAPLMARAPKAVGKVPPVAKTPIIPGSFQRTNQAAKAPVPLPAAKKAPENNNYWKKLPKMFESKKHAHKEEFNWTSFCGSKKPSSDETPASKPTLKTIWNIISSKAEISTLQQQPQNVKTYAQVVHEPVPRAAKLPTTYAQVVHDTVSKGQLIPKTYAQVVNETMPEVQKPQKAMPGFRMLWNDSKWDPEPQ
uniref:Testicular haploid expressed gene protein-like n=1 Tax=Globodera pallida TaxID=36090 RepID=A0A183C1B6_GLOPA